MQISRTLSQLTLKFLKKYKEIENDQLDIIEYGLTSFFSTIIKIIIILIISFALKITKEILVSIIAFGCLRHFAGGIHSKTPLSCLISMFIIYFSIVFLSLYALFNKYTFLITFSLCAITIFLYAPADVAEKPIINHHQKIRLKYSSLIVLIIMFILAYAINSNIMSNIIIFSCIAECITLIPITYTITNTERGDKYEKRNT